MRRLQWIGAPLLAAAVLAIGVAAAPDRPALIDAPAAGVASSVRSTGEPAVTGERAVGAVAGDRPAAAVVASRAMTASPPHAAVAPSPRAVSHFSPQAAVTFLPERPVQGTVFTVRVEPVAAPVEEIEATFAGEPLHFLPAGVGAYTALAAVPVDATDGLSLRLRYREGGKRVSSEIPVPIAAGDFRHEPLSVAPRFGRPPSPELRRRMAEESARAREVSRRSHLTPRLWEPPFVLPRESRVTSGFGDGREFNGQITSRHMGVDLAGASGSPVRAAARGVVALVDRFYLGGNVIYVDHGAGLVTAYLHLSEQLVAVGDTVEAGQVIGRVGATGRVTGPHLHWIVRYGQVTVDGRSLVGVGVAVTR